MKKTYGYRATKAIKEEISEDKTLRRYKATRLFLMALFAINLSVVFIDMLLGVFIGSVIGVFLCWIQALVGKRKRNIKNKYLS